VLEQAVASPARSMSDMTSELLNRLDAESKRRIAAELELEEEKQNVYSLNNRLKPLEDELYRLRSSMHIGESERAELDVKRVMESTQLADQGFDRMKRILADERERRDKSEQEIVRLKEDVRRANDMSSKSHGTSSVVQTTIDKLRERLEQECIAHIDTQGEARRYQSEAERLRAELTDSKDSLLRERSHYNMVRQDSDKVLGRGDSERRAFEDDINRLKRNLEEERAKRLQATSETIALQDQCTLIKQELTDANIALQRALSESKREKDQRAQADTRLREQEERVSLLEQELRRLKDDSLTKSTRVNIGDTLRITELEDIIQRHIEVCSVFFFSSHSYSVPEFFFSFFFSCLVRAGGIDKGSNYLRSKAPTCWHI
jgi:DNA repair exonuclease SbcCD ATPase subunit